MKFKVLSDWSALQYKEELGTPVFLTVNEIKTHRGRCYSAKYPLDINCMAKYFTFGESLVFFFFTVFAREDQQQDYKRILALILQLFAAAASFFSNCFLLLKEDMLPTMIQLLIAFKEDFDLIFFTKFWLFFNYVPLLVGCLDGFKEEM